MREFVRGKNNKWRSTRQGYEVRNKGEDVRGKKYKGKGTREDMKEEL